MSATTPTTTMDYFQVRLYPEGMMPQLGRSRLLIALGDISEIITVQRRDICALPGVPQGVIGVLNLRGQLIWGMDLRHMSRSWVPEARPNPQGKVTFVLVKSPQGQIGCVGEELLGIANCDPVQGVAIEADFRSAYAFCSGQFDLGKGETGLVLDTGQLFQHLSPTV